MNHINFAITANTYFDFIINKFFEISVFSTFNLSYIKKYIRHGPKSLHFGPSGGKTVIFGGEKLTIKLLVSILNYRVYTVVQR